MSNPFLLLSDSPSSTTTPYTSSSSKPVPISNDPLPSSSTYKDILQSVLLCTVDEQPSSSSAIYLAELAVGMSDNWDKNHIDQALFERLRMTDPASQLLTPSTNKKSGIRQDVNIVTENRCLHYLAGCYQRLLRQRVSVLRLIDRRKFVFSCRIILNWCWMIFENYLLIIVKQLLVYQIFTMVKI